MNDEKSNEQLSNEQRNNEQCNNEQCSNEQRNNEQRSNEQCSDEQRSNEKSDNEHLDSKQLSDEPQCPTDDLYIFEDTTSAGSPMSPITRITSIFTAPVRLVENIREYPRIAAAVIAILILSLIAAIFSMMILPIVSNVQSIAIAERYGTDFLNVTQATDQLMESSLGLTFIFSWIGVVFQVFLSVLWGTIMVKIITLIMKGSATFKQYLSLIIHTSIIALVGGSVVSLLMIATESAMTFTSLAPIFMPNGNFLNPIFNMLSSIEVFGIWSMIVIAIGVKKFNPSFSTGKAVAVTSIYYALNICLITAITSIAWLTYDLAYKSIEMM